MSVTTGILTAPPSGPSPARPRRVLARLVDAVPVLVVWALVGWPLLSGALGDALAAGGFASVGELARERSVSATGDGVQAALTELGPVLLTTLLLLALVAWAYEVLATLVAGTTPGKAVVALRVVLSDADGPFTTGVAGTDDTRAWWERPVRLGVRAAVVVLPPAVALGATTAAVVGVPGAGELAEVAIAVSIVLALAWAADGRGVHGAMTRTEVVPLSWQEAREHATQQLGTGVAAAQARAASEVTARSGVRPPPPPGAVPVRARDAWEQVDQTPLGPVARRVRAALDQVVGSGR